MRRAPLWLVVVVGLALAATTVGLTTVHDGASSPASPETVVSAASSGLEPAIFPAKPGARIGAWADRRPGRPQHLLTVAVLVAMVLCALVRLLVEGGAVRWRWHTVLQPWAQRAPPPFQHA